VGRLDKRKERIDLNKLVAEVVDMLDVPDHIDIAIDGELPVVEYEKTRITQVFENLLSNAVKYMDKPQGRIRIECVEEADYWRFSVADNGPGIKEEHFERIFQMFQTLASKDNCDSTGIGLALVKRIVEAYGGTVAVASEPGNGSTFTFTVLKHNSRTKHAELLSSTVG
jgi:signal transduction histidine kinase